MYVVSFVLLHPLGVLIASLAVNVNVNVPLVHDASTISHVGAFVSYGYVTVHCTVFHSSSANVTVHVAFHAQLLGGVTLIPSLLHDALHAVQLILHVLLIVPTPHAPSFGHIDVFKSLYNTFVHVTVEPYVNPVVVNVGNVSFIVNVALVVLVFHNLSLTVRLCVLLHAFGTCPAVTLNVLLHHVHPPKLVPLKLYALLAFIHAHHTSLALALQLFAVHSAVLAFANVIVGHALSYVHVISLLADAFVFHARSLNFPTHILAFAVPFHVVFAFTVHTATVFDTTLKLWIVPFVTVKSPCSTHCTASLNVHVIVYTVAFLHAAVLLVNVTLGPAVSISLNVTTTSTVEFSLSFNVIVHVSLHVFPLAGVYVNVVPFTTQFHFPPFTFTPL